jgi:DNA-directed RNA polymerase specialized sigma24 family protein
MVRRARKGKVLPFRGGAHGSDATDLQLLAAVRAGDNTALRDLFYRHGNRVHRVLHVDCGVESRWAARAVRDTFLRIARPVTRFDERWPVAGWIVRTALSLGVRASSLYPPPSRSDPVPGDAIAPPRAERLVEPDATPEVITALEETIASLSRGPRLAAALVEREKMSEADVTHALGVRVRVLWRWVSQARTAVAPVTSARPRSRGLARVKRAVRTGRLCPPAWQLQRAVSLELDSRMGWHLSACTSCSNEYAHLAGLSARLSSLPRHEMVDAVRDAIAISLLAAPLGAAREGR